MIKRFGILVLACLAILSTSAQRASYNIIPLPKEVKADTTKMFTLTSGMGIAYDASNAECSRIALFLQEWVKETTGMRLILTPSNKNAFIRL